MSSLVGDVQGLMRKAKQGQETRNPSNRVMRPFAPMRIQTPCLPCLGQNGILVAGAIVRLAISQAAHKQRNGNLMP